MSFSEEFARLFDSHFPWLCRVLDRISGEPDLAADLAQEAFVRLYRRGVAPDRPQAWLVTVGLNLLRNDRSTRVRRLRIGTDAAASGDLPGTDRKGTDGDAGAALRVRGTLARMPERERRLLCLQAEGFRYREIADLLDLNEASIGTLLARAKKMFRDLYEGDHDDASRR